MHFLIITLSCLQTIIWICCALFALSLSCIIQKQSQQFAAKNRRIWGGGFFEWFILWNWNYSPTAFPFSRKYYKPFDWLQSLFRWRRRAQNPGGLQTGAINFALHSTVCNMKTSRLKDSCQKKMIHNKGSRNAVRMQPTDSLGAKELWQEKVS